LSGDPGGIRTRDLDLERVASWARLDDGVGERQYTRCAEALAAPNDAVVDTTERAGPVTE
jgi:hypothetical protein